MAGISATVPYVLVAKEEEEVVVKEEVGVVVQEEVMEYVLGLEAENGLVLGENARQRRRIMELEAVVERLAVKLRVLEEKRRVKRPRCRFC